MNKFWIVGKAKDNTPEILVYGLIGGDEGINSSDFVKELRALEKTSNLINVRINSVGGSVWEGFAIFNALVNCRAEIHIYIDGVAASMGSIIAMAGKKVFMSKYARLMTHSASGAGTGNSSDMRQTAQLLDSIDNTMCVVYSQRTGKTTEECKTAYVGTIDKWFTADQALGEKLIDGIYDAAPVAIPENIKGQQEVWDIYNPQFAAVFNQTQNNNDNMKDLTLSAAAKTAMNIGDNADPSAIATAIDALVAKAAKVDLLQANLTAAEQKVKDIEEAAAEKEVTEVLATAVTEKKMTVEMQKAFAVQFKGKPTELKAIVATMKPFESVVKKVEGDVTELESLTAKTYDQLDKAGELPKLKKLSIDVFKAKFKEHYKKDYAGE